MSEEAKKSAGGKKLRLFFLNLGKLILDAAKLCFGSLVLGTIIKGDIPQSTLLGWGILASGVGAVIAIFLVTIFEER